MLMAKSKTDSAMEKENQSPKIPEKEILVGNKNAKLKWQVPLKPQF